MGAEQAETAAFDAFGVAATFFEEVKARAGEAEAARVYPQDLADRMAEAGLYRMCNPKAYGGLEADPVSFCRAVEGLAEADAAAAWVVFIGVSSMVGLAGFAPEAATSMLADPKTKAAGVFAPRGRANPAEQDGEAGFMLSGRWQWGSGTQNCDWLMAGAFVTDADGGLAMLDNGRPDHRMFALRREQVSFIDTWHVSGLRGTGSTDFAVDNVFVPERFASSFFDPSPRDEPIFNFPKFGFLAIGIASVALGITRAAIDELKALAGAKTPEGARRPLAMKSATQRGIGEAEAAWKAARLFFYHEVERSWAHAVAHGEPPTDVRRDLRLGVVHAVQTCAEAVGKMYELGGGTSVYETSPLQKHFRDIHVATQHIMTTRDVYDLAGRLFLGLDTDTAML